MIAAEAHSKDVAVNSLATVWLADVWRRDDAIYERSFDAHAYP